MRMSSSRWEVVNLEVLEGGLYERGAPRGGGGRRVGWCRGGRGAEAVEDERVELLLDRADEVLLRGER